MKYLIPIAIALSFLLLIAIFYTLTGEISGLKDEVSDLKKGYNNRISALEDKIDLCAEEKKALIAEVREIIRPLTRLIFIDGWALGLREENP